MNAQAGLAIGAAMLMASCAPSQQERQARIDAVNQSMDTRFDQIESEYQTRIAAANNDQERAAVMQWQRDAFTDAIREQQSQISAIHRGE